MESPMSRENQAVKGGLRRPGRRTAEKRALGRAWEGTSVKRMRLEKRTAGSSRRRGGKSRAMMNSAGNRRRASRPYPSRKSKLFNSLFITKLSFYLALSAKSIQVLLRATNRV
jgi:hypothetical protein